MELFYAVMAYMVMAGDQVISSSYGPYVSGLAVAVVAVIAFMIFKR
jgi:hypothetical protein